MMSKANAWLVPTPDQRIVQVSRYCGGRLRFDCILGHGSCKFGDASSISLVLFLNPKETFPMPSYTLSARSGYFDGAIYQRMSDDLHLAGMSKRTVHGYLRAVRQLADCCTTPPE